MIYDTGYMKPPAEAVSENEYATMYDLASWVIQEAIRRRAVNLLDKDGDKMLKELPQLVHDSPIGTLLPDSGGLEDVIERARQYILYGKLLNSEERSDKGEELADEYLEQAAARIYNQLINLGAE